MIYRKYSIVNILLWLVWSLGLIFVITFMLFTCSNKGMANDRQTGNDVYTEEPDRKEFRMVTIPETLTTSSQRAEYLATNYWKHFDFSDTTYIHLPAVTEQAFADYLRILPHTEEQTAAKSIAAMLGECIDADATGKMYAYFLEKHKSYLYNPSSPLRNEEFYIPVVQYIISDTVSDEVTKSRASFDYSMMLKNRKGTIATDFEYTTAANGKGRLYALNKNCILISIIPAVRLTEKQ